MQLVPLRRGCTIVPFAALGVDDAFNIALDSTVGLYTFNSVYP
jgi:hypothetical protein